MYDKHIECERFDQWLLGGSTELESPVWREHLKNCDECSQQWHAHQMLALTFAEEPVPELSPYFEAALDRKIASLDCEDWTRSHDISLACVASSWTVRTCFYNADQKMPSARSWASWPAANQPTSHTIDLRVMSSLRRSRTETL